MDNTTKTPTDTEVHSIAIVGSRQLSEEGVERAVELIQETIEHALGGLAKPVQLVSGGAVGVDRMAERLFKAAGLPVKIFYPDWKTYGKRAGYLRNEQIVNAADTMLAIWDGVSKGTRHSIELMKKAGKPVQVEVV